MNGESVKLEKILVKKKSKTFEKYGLFLIIFPVMAIAFECINSAFDLNVLKTSSNTLVVMFILIIFAIEFIKNLRTGMYTPILIKICIVISILQACIGLVNMGNTEHSVSSIINFSFPWVAVLYVSYSLKNKYQSCNIENVGVLLMLFMIILMNYLNLEKISMGIRFNMNSTYWLVLCLPFILRVKFKIFRYLGLIVLLVATVVSLKRTAIIAVALGLTTYAIVKYLTIAKFKLKSMFVVIVIVGAGISSISSYDYISEKYNIDMFQRFQDLKIDGGSGRDKIYESVLSMQYNSNVYDWVIGRGQEGVALRGTEYGVSAHNDFLEVLYDYGIFTFLLYICIYFQLIKHLKYMLANKMEAAASFAASITLFFVVSCFSQLITTPSYFILLCLFWGISLADNKDYSSPKAVDTLKRWC